MEPRALTRIPLRCIRATGWALSIANDVNKYGGDGCEVMLDVRGELFIGPKAFPVSGFEFGGSYSYNHQVRLESPLPAGVSMPSKLPIIVSIAIEGSITGDGGGYFLDVSAVVNGVGSGVGSPFAESPISYSKSFVTWVAPNTNYSASVRGYIVLNSGGSGSHTFGQLIVDPFMIIDPSYAYASNFGVYQKKDGIWVELNRDWMQPVPEPETYAMLLAGLGLLGVMVRRRRNAWAKMT